MAVTSCVGSFVGVSDNVADGAILNLASMGNKVFRVTARDSNGTVTTKDVPFMVNSRDYEMNANLPVDTTMELTLPAAGVTFPTFIPSIPRDYIATAALGVRSTAGNTAVTVHDAAATTAGRLVNGGAALVQPVAVWGASSNPAAAAGATGPIGGASAPRTLVNYSAPVQNDPLTVTFRQTIGSTEALRSGTYSKTLTFTLSTTAPSAACTTFWRHRCSIAPDVACNSSMSVLSSPSETRLSCVARPRHRRDIERGDMRAKLAGLGAGVVGALAVAALLPSAAQAHPCAMNWSLSTATFLSANNSAAAWAGSLPTMNNDSDCAPVEDAYTGPASVATTGADAAADPVGPAVESFEYTPNMTPLGYSQRTPPLGTGTSLADINSDIAFKGNLAFQGHWSGFRVLDITDATNPVQLYNTEACRHTSGQGDVVVHGNILVRTWDSSNSTGANANATCMGDPVGNGFEGIHIWNIADPAQPGLRPQAADGRDRQRPGCARGRLRCAHGDRRAGRRARQPVSLRRRLERHLHGHGRRADQPDQPGRRRLPAAGQRESPVP